MQITNLINNKLKEEQEKPRVRSGKFGIGSLGKCYRAQFWNRKDEPISNPVDDRVLRIFKVGNIFHEFVQGLLSEYQSEVKVELNDLIGYADIVMDNEVIDIKSVNSKMFWYMDKDGYNIDTEKRTNILQVCAYAWLLDKPIGRLVFISRDDLSTREYGFYTDKWKPEIEKELVVLRDCWAKDLLPPAEPRCYYNKKKKVYNECAYCLWQNHCKEIENALT